LQMVRQQNLFGPFHVFSPANTSARHFNNRCSNSLLASNHHICRAEFHGKN
jgi:hypothetical protein